MEKFIFNRSVTTIKKSLRNIHLMVFFFNLKPKKTHEFYAYVMESQMNLFHPVEILRFKRLWTRRLGGSKLDWEDVQLAINLHHHPLQAPVAKATLSCLCLDHSSLQEPALCGPHMMFDEDRCECVCKAPCPGDLIQHPENCSCFECEESLESCCQKHKMLHPDTCRSMVFSLSP